MCACLICNKTGRHYWTNKQLIPSGVLYPLRRRRVSGRRDSGEIDYFGLSVEGFWVVAWLLRGCPVMLVGWVTLFLGISDYLLIPNISWSEFHTTWILPWGLQISDGDSQMWDPMETSSGPSWYLGTETGKWEFGWNKYYLHRGRKPMWGALEDHMGPDQEVGEGRVRPVVKGKPLKCAESLICQAWCKCFKHGISFNDTLGGLNYYLHFTHWETEVQNKR